MEKRTMKIQNREEDAYRQLKEKILAGVLFQGIAHWCAAHAEPLGQGGLG